MPEKQLALAAVQQRWQTIFSALRNGHDVPPALRLRTEGFMEALVMLELSSEQALQTALEQAWLDCFAEPLAADWRELFPFPQLPGFARRAPVYPSTRS